MDHLGALHAADRRPLRLASLRQDVAALSQVYASASSTELNSPHPNFLPPRFEAHVQREMAVAVFSVGEIGGQQRTMTRRALLEEVNKAAGGSAARARSGSGEFEALVPPLAARDVRKLDPILGGRSEPCVLVRQGVAQFFGAQIIAQFGAQFAYTARATLAQAASSSRSDARR